MNPHVFAGNPLDHGDVQRRDQRMAGRAGEESLEAGFCRFGN